MELGTLAGDLSTTTARTHCRLRKPISGRYGDLPRLSRSVSTITGVQGALEPSLCSSTGSEHISTTSVHLQQMCPEPVEGHRAGKLAGLVHNFRTDSCRLRKPISMITGCRGSTFFVAPTIRSTSAVHVILKLDCSSMRPVVGTRIRGVVDRWSSLGLKNVSTLTMRTCWNTRSRDGDVRRSSR